MQSIVDVESTGTEAGMSITLEGASCNRKAWLMANTPYDPSVLYPEDGKAAGNLVGSMMHACLARWYPGERLLSPTFTWYGKEIESTHPLACAEARRLFAWYDKEFKRAEFGRIVAVERNFKFDPQAKFLPGFTGALDLVVDISGAELPGLARQGLYLPQPGMYYVDHKCMAAASKSAEEEYRLRPQFTGYTVGAEELGFPVLGAIVNRIIKTKDPKRALYFVPPPDVHAVKMIQTLVSNRLKIIQGAELDSQCSPEDCMDEKYGRKCQFLFKGCNRY